jgi:YbbR domain-containing protein
MRSLNRNNLLKLFTSEWLKKLLAVVFAAVLWWFVNYWSYTEQSFSLPIQFKNLPADLVVLETSDTAASFVAKGKAESVKNISQNKSIKPIVYLDDAKTGTNLYKIELVLNEPQSDLIINLMKDKVRLRIDRIATRVLPVQPTVIGSPADGFIVENVTLDRNMITVKGPSEVLASMEYVETKAIQISGASNDITLTVVPELQKMITALSPEKFQVTVNIAKKKEKNEPVKKDQ